MRVVLGIVFIICVAGVSFMLYSEHEKLQKHPAIIACEESVKEALRTPDTYKLKTATMEVFDSDPHTITLDFRYTNPFAVESRGVAICSYTQGNPDRAVDEYQVKRGEWKPRIIREEVSPFTKFDLGDVEIDGIIIDPDIVLPQVLWLISNRKGSKADYLPGKIVAYDKPHQYTYKTGKYVYEDKPLMVKVFDKYFK